MQEEGQTQHRHPAQPSHAEIWPRCKKHLVDITNNNAFCHTSICPDDIAALAKHKNKVDKDTLFETPADPRFIIDCLDEELEFVRHNDTWYLVVYTDGSTLMPESPVFARSGYGFFIAKDHTLNYHNLLEGASQSTYRAELRAIIHVIKHAAANILVRSDCKSVVDGFNKLLAGSPIDRKNDDIDLWDYAAECLRLIEDRSFKVEWMPSHLEEKEQEHKRNKYLKGGGTLRAIDGNVGADALAKKTPNCIPPAVSDTT